MFDLKDNLGLAQCFKAFPVAMVIDVLIRKKGEVASTKRPRTDKERDTELLCGMCPTDTQKSYLNDWLCDQNKPNSWNLQKNEHQQGNICKHKCRPGGLWQSRDWPLTVQLLYTSSLARQVGYRRVAVTWSWGRVIVRSGAKSEERYSTLLPLWSVFL